ncbi:MAG: hypothetical protein ACP5SP_07755, partial [Caldisericum sp.]|uniref:hypothetical protein n=1 Tax=Caldisericum sp. TaxID=2499687 RepID=UPI003D096C3C
MSLIVSIKVGKNIIIAADTRVHFPKTGYYSDNAKKIFIFEGKIAIGWIGDQDFSLKTIENFKKIISKENFSSLNKFMLTFQQVAVTTYKDFFLLTG